MFDFSREVFICKCSTAVDVHQMDDDPDAQRLRFIQGSAADVERLDRQYHDAGHVQEIRERLARNEYWMVGELDGEIVTYTFLYARESFEYTYLPGCRFAMGSDTAYGYGAWTPNHLRGKGLRRRAFLEELDILRRWGKAWEASVFIKQQIEGANRSLAKVGIEILPLWRVEYTRDRRLVAERLAPDERSVLPLFDSTAAPSRGTSGGEP
jgi:hypothetical protein